MIRGRGTRLPLLRAASLGTCRARRHCSQRRAGGPWRRSSQSRARVRRSPPGSADRSAAELAAVAAGIAAAVLGALALRLWRRQPGLTSRASMTRAPSWRRSRRVAGRRRRTGLRAAQHRMVRPSPWTTYAPEADRWPFSSSRRGVGHARQSSPTSVAGRRPLAGGITLALISSGTPEENRAAVGNGGTEVLLQENYEVNAGLPCQLDACRRGGELGRPDRQRAVQGVASESLIRITLRAQRGAASPTQACHGSAGRLTVWMDRTRPGRVHCPCPRAAPSGGARSGRHRGARPRSSRRASTPLLLKGPALAQRLYREGENRDYFGHRPVGRATGPRLSAACADRARLPLGLEDASESTTWPGSCTPRSGARRASGEGRSGSTCTGGWTGCEAPGDVVWDALAASRSSIDLRGQGGRRPR